MKKKLLILIGLLVALPVSPVVISGSALLLANCKGAQAADREGGVSRLARFFETIYGGPASILQTLWTRSHIASAMYSGSIHVC